MCDLPTKYVKIWSYYTFACGLAKSVVQDCSNSTVSMTIAIETMELLQFCTKIWGTL